IPITILSRTRVLSLAQTEIQSQNQSQPRQTANLSELDAISARLWQIAQDQQSDAASLLQILRVIEVIHKRIRDDLFQPALPTSRHELFNLLRDIETNGGWPHIYRMKINEICRYLEQPEELEQ
ncbi:MAG: hypothetical protein ACK5WL_10400, partial [Pseudanabaena sp.]